MREIMREILLTLFWAVLAVLMLALLLAPTSNAQCRSCGPVFSPPVYWQPAPIIVPGTGGPPVMAPTTAPKEGITVKDLSTAKPADESAGEPKEGPFRQMPNYGVDLDRLGKEPCYKVNGLPCSREQAFQVLADTIPNDAGNLRLTIFGSPQAQQELLAVVNQALSDPALKSRWTVQKYGTDSWIVKQYGFVVDPVQPTLYMQAPTGEVLHRSVGVPDAQQLQMALRRADPNYDPSKDPNLFNQPDPAKTGGPAALIEQLLTFVRQNGLLLMAGAFLFVLFYGKRGD